MKGNSSSGAIEYCSVSDGTRMETIFRVYDARNNLVHEETLYGKLLNTTNKHDRKFLNKRMKEAISQKAIASNRRANRTKKG